MNYGVRQPRSGRLAESIRMLPPGDILPAEEQLALLLRWREDRDAEALVRLVRSQAPLVYGLASRLGWKYAPAGADGEDLAQAGFVAVMEAVRRYEIGHPSGIAFSSYVYWGVHMTLHNAIRSLPARRHRRRDLRLHLLDEDGPLIQPQPEPDPFEELLGGGWDRLDEVLARVDARARAIVVRHWGCDGAAPETFRQIAARSGISPERVRQLKDRALGKMRAELDAMLHRDEGNRSARGVVV